MHILSSANRLGTARYFPSGWLSLVVICLLLPVTPGFAGRAVEADPGEMQAKKNWLNKHLLQCKARQSNSIPSIPEPTRGKTEPGLDVLANNDAVTQNGRGGHPMKIGDREFRRGLYCHAVSKVLVTLPGPGKCFRAVAGLDHNDDTARGKGSVVFTVASNNKALFTSGVMKYGTPPCEIQADLEGATAFMLEVGDAGDGIGWDQCDWADARVELTDGRIVWLGDMPLRDFRTAPPVKPIARTRELPFSFVYGGRSSDELLATWTQKNAARKLDALRTEHSFEWSDPHTGLEVRCVAVDYRDYPVVEWTVYFKNNSSTDTPILENIQGLDLQIHRKAGPEFVLHGNKGDWCVPQSYEPYRIPLSPGSTQQFFPDGGRPTNGPKGWPFFNLQTREGGLILAVGWPGQWTCAFLRDELNGLRVVAGQADGHFYLKPGEQFRSPLIALMLYGGADATRSQNLWRRWFMAHNIPRINGQPPAAMLQMQCYRTFEKGGEQDLFDTVEEFNRTGIEMDLCWRDAGWYPCKNSWPNTGTWQVDPSRYPNGFRPFSDWIHQQGKKFIVWFEPERVGDRDSWLAREHPDWILGGNLLNLGNPDAWKWLANHIDKILVEQGIDYYRQDFNMDPLGNWRSNDTPDRQGVTEQKYVLGYLAFWDELRRRHPGLLIDSCASGGRRNDLETLRRSVPLLRSDYQFGHEATMPNQSQTHGISSWIPYYGSGCAFTDKYSARSYIMPCSGFGGTNAETKRAYSDCRKAAPYMLGDYYPLTPYTLQPSQWIAWQFDRPESDQGMVQAFRRDQCTLISQSYKLHGLRPNAKYEITDLDEAPPRVMTGKQLMKEGLPITVQSQPGAAVLFYRRLK